MAHEFRLTGNIYVSKSGNNANAGTDPNAPKLTIAAGVAALGSGQTLIVGSGIYTEHSIVFGDSERIYGDGIVIMSGIAGQTCFTFSDYSVCEGIRFTGFFRNIFMDTPNSNYAIHVNDCIFIGGDVYTAARGAGRYQTISRCTFINCATVIARRRDENQTIIPVMDNCIIINSNIYDFSRIENSYIDLNSSVRMETQWGDQRLLNCNVRTSDLTNHVLSNSINADPLFLGNVSRLELTVAAKSPMIAAGLNNVNIGNVKTGKIQRYNTLEWGLSPAANTNTRFNINNALEVITGNTGTRESKEIDMGQVVRSPVLRLNGFVDFLNNVPDFVALSNPNHLTVEVAYAGLDKVFTAYKSFRWNEKIQLDNTGKSTGEAGFDWGNTVETNFRFIKIRVTSRNNYTVA